MRLRLDCQTCSYWLWCETPEGSGTISIACPNCGHSISKTVLLPQPRRDVAGSPAQGSSASFWFGAGAHPTKNQPAAASSPAELLGSSSPEPEELEEDDPGAPVRCGRCGSSLEWIQTTGGQDIYRCSRRCASQQFHQQQEART